MGKGKRWACMGNWAHNSVFYKGRLGCIREYPVALQNLQSSNSMEHQDTAVTFRGDLHFTVLFPQSKNFSYCANESTLLYMHRWTSTRGALLISPNCLVHKNQQMCLEISDCDFWGDKQRFSLFCQARRHMDFQSWMLLNLSASPSVYPIYTAECRI